MSNPNPFPGPNPGGPNVPQDPTSWEKFLVRAREILQRLRDNWPIEVLAFAAGFGACYILSVLF